ncbi:MAG: DNA-directed RNA polymerase subunit beta' [Bacteroidetes bacterium GWE2_40_63]|jgi:DNA-directed RNA polymerase subunit beta'|nr:MAG: DNA-directed RNA polymerase subunit beta' [Bacteroidetes bacterium GWD2_40_43]OFX92630.1 MAG: DNA-directed RNA polymerase subunit beta' [Bacteroidetes bacterium GWE2_40_63]OFY17487.1 MAG: DNA-directed RNA polymerase subunit beta' [Bacteroidetes bacterium GWF2_40_13]OFZ27580.1 MAG: DNA-directed RNA polymerase subunit beta' [Bacteroidetes bacterium RIFOXYC2_FULL_40_12]HBX85902.1 DNA-directed RNA polymerase subunit beta' [Marinilabiliales bacterium]
MAFRKENKAKSDFSRISIGLASPEEVLERSSGEVLKPETINYRTYKPERDGLFCERIFGPVKDYECHCGKYKRIRYKGIVCDRCGVEVTEKKVRRERMGHIQLVVPVAHIWYFKSLPNKIGYLLGLPTKKLDSIIYYERYVVINPGVMADEGVQYLDFLTEEEYLDYSEKLPKENLYLEDTDPNKFVAKMGAEALYALLERLDLDELSYSLRHKANTETSQQRKNEALKRLQVVESFRASAGRNKPEWMIVKVVPVIPPELRPLVPLDGGRFATSDLNDLYRRVIIRNNRLKRLIEIKAPEVILRNEKRMLQEAVDSLFDNSRKSNAVKTESNRALKSLSDSLKGKQGRFRQNLLGKRVDYSARSVIVVGPELKMHECGLPKNMAAELYKPFIIRKLIERGIVKTVKSAKKIVDRKDPVVWDILENVLKGHPVLLNRAPTLHRLGIQAFQPKLIEGKAIQLHPLACTAFNADFDGDQMAVHLPLGNAAILEAQMLMLGSHNILNPANGAPITVPSQDMVLGLYYITKGRTGVKGEGSIFYSPEEVTIAYNERKVALHANIKVKTRDLVNGELKNVILETTVGRVIVNQFVPAEVGYINELFTKKSLRDIIGKIYKTCGTAVTAKFLDDIKDLGYRMAFEGGLSFNLGDVIIPSEKTVLVDEGYAQVDEVMNNYNMGFITNNERYNQIIDIWTHTNAKLTQILMKQLSTDNQGFNSVYMMLDSGARGSKEQIRQLSGMRGLMAKPQKSGAEGGQIIENPILSNFKEGLSVLEYFISTHGARKGLADTALKTADAGYLTRRLVDVSQDVIINEEDCGTLRGLVASTLKKNEEVVETLYERILGRTSVHDIYHPITGKLIVVSGEEFTESIARVIEESPIEQVEMRSVLTCESKNGVCAKCYGRNLANSRMVQMGEAVGVIAAQSIGEPGTQLTLRTFHVGGTAGNIATDSSVIASYEGRVEFEELRTIEFEDQDGSRGDVVIGRLAEVKLFDKNTNLVLSIHAIPYGSKLYVKEGADVKKGDVICEWDPYNAVIVSEAAGIIHFVNVEEGITFREEADEQTGFREKVIIETRDKTKNPTIKVTNEAGEQLKTYNLPVGAHVVIDEGAKVRQGQVIVKIPRSVGKAGDITGGLPRVTELFEARNPSNPAVVAEIDGEISFGKIKRGNREIIVTSRTGEVVKYLVPLSKQILVQENDYVKAGIPLSDGAITPSDILAIKGPTKVQEYIVNEVQEVYRLQGVKINDKHFEVIVRQMMRKVEIVDPGDTIFLEKQVVDKNEFMEENDWIWDKKVVTDAGDSGLRPGQIITARKLRDENSILKRKDLKLVEARDAVAATSSQILQGITRAALQTRSFISAASFQETTKVLNEAAINGKIDGLEGLKENVIVGHLIPAGTGSRRFTNMIVGNKEDYENLVASKRHAVKQE